jgi:hypothetical protein
MAPQKGGDIPVKSEKSLEMVGRFQKEGQNQEQPMGFKHKEGNGHNICAEGSCIRQKVLEIPLLGNYLEILFLWLKKLSIFG